MSRQANANPPKSYARYSFSAVQPPPTAPDASYSGTPLPPGWVKVASPQGDYFHNTTTNETSWSAPLPADNRYRDMYGSKRAQVETLRKSLGVLDAAVYLPPSAPLPPTNLPPNPYPPFPPPQPGTERRLQVPMNAMERISRGPPPPPSGPPPNAPPPPGGPPPGPPPAAPPKAPPMDRGPKEEKEALPKWKHRLRAFPMLARNFAMIGCGLNFWGGFIILSVDLYRDGINNTSVLIYPSPYGVPMGLWCMGIGLGSGLFERWSWMRPQAVHVMPWLWNLRAVMYIGFAVPGFLMLTQPTPLLPPFMGALIFFAAGVLNLISCFGVLPNEKEWAWPWFGETKANKAKKEEEGAKFDTFFDLVIMCPYRTCCTAFEQNTLGRSLFLAVYFSLNVVLFIHAYDRHGNSNKGKALRGEAFYLCGTPPNAAPCPVTMGCYSAETCPSGATLTGPIPLLQPPSETSGGVNAGVWFPVAKGFGQLLNLNCAIMILPVFRKAVMKMHDITSLRKSGFLAWLPVFVPFDKNVVFHKAVAKYFIVACVFGHGTSHYINYAYAPYYNKAFTDAGLPHVYAKDPIIAAWSPKPTETSAFLTGGQGFTGNLLIIVMVTIYAGAHDTVKRRHYETFWITHHFFVLWFFFLLMHGPIWWQWALVCLLPYAFDRIVLRIMCRGGTKMALARVYFWGKPGKPDVITLQFDNAISDKGKKPVDYWEGHYLYLHCPAIGGGCLEWHPFTISSAPDEPVLEVNIRIMPSEHAWTNRVAKYLMLLDPMQTGEVELTSRNPTSGEVTLGKVLGPDGRPFFRVDAPHGAPSQHVFQYRTSMLVGAGIGVTPCASILKGVINYRWKKGFTPHNLHFFWVARLSDLTTFKWLLLMLPELKRLQLVHNQYYAQDHSEASRKMLKNRLRNLQAQMENNKADPANALKGIPPSMPPGWEEAHTPEGQLYYFNRLTNETAWSRPVGRARATDEVEEELSQVQEGLKMVGQNERGLTITLYLTGAKPDQIRHQQDAKPGSTGEMVNALLSTSDPESGEPYIILKAGRPDWDKEFVDLATMYGREDIGVVFCGAPLIAAALKSACEKHSDRNKTVFRLHKENF